MDKKKDKLKYILKEFKREVNKKVKIDKLIFFGSRATKKSKKTSDIDLLLISKNFKGKKYFKRSPKFYLMWDYPYDVDILCLTPEELAKKQKQTGIIQQAVKEGILI
tara:strand:+ start:156 stop:476 length:321 start_codon:yes stop_codon:yes gene_type:complete